MKRFLYLAALHLMAPASETEGSGASPTPATPVEAKSGHPGIGKFCKDLIRAGKTNKEVLAEVAKEFPGAKTKMASINWYRNDMKKNGENVPASAGRAPAAPLTPEQVAQRKAELKAKRKAKNDAKKAAANNAATAATASEAKTTPTEGAALGDALS